MISVLIPIYNFDCRSLVSELSSQLQKNMIPFEILAFDDGSTQFVSANRSISSIKGAVYKRFKPNVGRSAIRNRLAKEARYPFLLFMDCDSAIESNDYIRNYLDVVSCKSTPLLCICGGRIYPPIQHIQPKYYLHYTYGIKREPSPCIGENKNMFLSNNFLISKSLFTDIFFNEAIRNYGHEDTLFGFQLKNRNIEITHINNPIIHIGLDDNKSFLTKTVSGVKNLFYLYKHILSENESKQIKLIRYYTLIKKLHCIWLVKLFYQIAKPIVISNLMGSKPLMIFLDLYKLYYFSLAASK